MEAAKRQNLGVKLPQGSEDQAGKARDKAAVMVGVSGTYVSMAKTMLADAPELEDRVMSGELPLGQAYAIARSLGRV